MGKLYLPAIALVLTPLAARAEAPRDPLQSPMWASLAATLFGDARVRFDDRVKVVHPGIAENQRAFPVAIDARGIAGVRRMILFADLNPIPLAIDYTLASAQAYVSTRIKLDQRTPVRGAVQLTDGSWLVSGDWVDAAGGGCSAPPLSRVKGDWAEHLGEVRGIAVRDAGATRVRLAFRHPMDTGLVANIPTYHLETVELSDAAGGKVGTIAVEASVAEDPELTVIAQAPVGDMILLSARDTNGIGYGGRLAVTGAAAAALATR